MSQGNGKCMKEKRMIPTCMITHKAHIERQQLTQISLELHNMAKKGSILYVQISQNNRKKGVHNKS